MVYIVLETMWAYSSPFYPEVLVGSGGVVKKFNTKKQAKEYGKRFALKPLVVEIPQE